MDCKPCTHPRRDEIDRNLIHGRPLRAIAAEYGCSLGGLSRHTKHVREVIRERITGEREERAGALLNRVEEVLEQAKVLVDVAKAQNNVRAANGSLRTILACLELIGKLTGELVPPNVSGIHLTSIIRVGNNYAPDDDKELAKLVGEATGGFSIHEFNRLKLLVTSSQLGDKKGTQASGQIEPIDIKPLKELG
jgi:hypothetical protein